MGDFRFKQFALSHECSTLKIGTDALLLATLTDVGNAQSLLDIGCGCGVVAFCLAQKLSARTQHPLIYGIDPDEDSIAECRDNASRFPLLAPQCFHFVPTRLQEFVPSAPRPFDLVVSNPPFFGNDLKPSTTARLKSKHRDGQLPFPELLDGVCQLLHPEGRFVVILPYIEGEAFHRMACERLHGVRRVFIRPTPTKPFHRVVLEYALRPVAPLVEHELTIRDAQNRYTPAYAHLVHPFLQNSNP